MNDRADLARLCTSLFGLSSAFPVAACLMVEARRPFWLGIGDVVVAIAFVAVAIAVQVRNHSRVAITDRAMAQQVSGRIVWLVPTLLVLFFTHAVRIDWTVLVIGLSWRAWLMLLVLPEIAVSRRLRASP